MVGPAAGPWGPMTSPLAGNVVALLLLASGVVVLVAATGLVRLPDFFARMHAPALASTLAAWIVTLRVDPALQHARRRAWRCMCG